jgi:hypothetical protein
MRFRWSVGRVNPRTLSRKFFVLSIAVQIVIVLMPLTPHANIVSFGGQCGTRSSSLALDYAQWNSVKPTLTQIMLEDLPS